MSEAKLTQLTADDVRTLVYLIESTFRGDGCPCTWEIAGLFFKTGFNHKNRDAKGELSSKLNSLWELHKNGPSDIYRELHNVVIEALHQAEQLARHERDQDHTKQR